MLEWVIVIMIVAGAAVYLAMRLWRRVRSNSGKGKPRTSRPQKMTIGKS